MKVAFQAELATVDQLVQRFVEIALAQYDANYRFDVARYNRLYRAMEKVRSELKSRQERSALLPLLQADNLQVRLQAATELLAIAPDQAQSALLGIRETGTMPQAAEAGLMLNAFDRGEYRPT
jgi:enoyl reductase-like protein